MSYYQSILLTLEPKKSPGASGPEQQGGVVRARRGRPTGGAGVLLGNCKGQGTQRLREPSPTCRSALEPPQLPTGPDREDNTAPGAALRGCDVVCAAPPAPPTARRPGPAGDCKSHQAPRRLHRLAVAGKGGSGTKPAEGGWDRSTCGGVVSRQDRIASTGGCNFAEHQLPELNTPAFHAGSFGELWPGRLRGAGDLSLREPPAPALPGRGEVADWDPEDAAVARIWAAAWRRWPMRAVCGLDKMKCFEEGEDPEVIWRILTW
ncbi:uncharacterized protein [Eulemur rufifrons]|uniref:uncharacterized protein n=1 Tax=Eulemur rufifrons TaxID=859984 RepID=UPI00374331B8